MPSPVTIEIQGLGRIELGLSAADWDRMTDGERQELVTRIAVDAGAVRPSSSLGAAALSSMTDSLPAAVSAGGNGCRWRHGWPPGTREGQDHRGPPEPWEHGRAEPECLGYRQGPTEGHGVRLGVVRVAHHRYPT